MKNQKGFSAIEVLVAIVVILAIGYSGYYVINRNDSGSLNSQDSADTANIKEELPTELSNLKPLEELQSQVENEFQGLSVYGIELEIENGKTVYVFHLSDGRVVAYDAYSGESVVLSDDEDDEIGEDGFVPVGFNASLSIQEAIAIARAQRPDSTLKKVEIELENGIVVYSVRFTDGSRVDVSATNGAVERLKDETGEDVIKSDSGDSSDDDSSDSDDDDDDDDDEDDEDDEDDDDDDNSSNSGSGSSNSGSNSN